MTDRRISRVVPGELSHDERRVVSDVVLEYDSDFRVKAGSVANVSQVLPEPGVMVISEHDGRMYYADNYGWHQQGALWSPITLFVEFNGTDQFNFKFKAPADSADPSVLIIHDGDGTITEVDGDDDTLVTHTTNYATAGTYYFYVEGDVLDITYIDLDQQAFISGLIDGFKLITGLTLLDVEDTLMTGSVYGFEALTEMTDLNIRDTTIGGDITLLASLTSLVRLKTNHTNVVGDVSNFSLNSAIINLWLTESAVTFNSIQSWDMTGSVLLTDCGLTSTMVDNALNSFVGLTGCNLNLGGNNAARTSASDAAYATVNANNTLTVN